MLTSVVGEWWMRGNTRRTIIRVDEGRTMPWVLAEEWSILGRHRQVYAPLSVWTKWTARAIKLLPC